MASEPVRIVLGIPGCATSNGVLYIEPFSRRTPTFKAGGYNWSISFDPYTGDDLDYFSLFLNLENHGVTTTAEVDINLLDPSGAMSPWKLTAEKLSWEFDSGDEDRWRLSVWAPRSLLSSAPGPGFLTRGGVLFEFIISVLPTDAPQSASSAQPIVPPSDKKDNLARVYQTKEGADVIYSVKGELFPAHKIILAMGSPVFKAELYGNMMESTAKVIQVKDMEPDVFEALLNYIYTDSLPTGNEDQDDKDVSSIICGLLVAGDRYGVDRLKLLCELELCTMLDVDNVAKMLEFANDQQCNVLKDACTAFIVNSDQMDKIKKSEGYTRLFESRPSILVEVLERAYQFRKVS